MFGVYLPERLYEALPYLYVTSGVGTMVMIQGLLALVSGLLLVGAGSVVWRWRRAYRRLMRPDPTQSVGQRQADRRELENALRQINDRLR